jgi:hypothetical protein
LLDYGSVLDNYQVGFKKEKTPVGVSVLLENYASVDTTKSVSPAFDPVPSVSLASDPASLTDDFPPQICSVTYLDDLSDSAAEYFCNGVIIAPDLVLTTADSDNKWRSFYTLISVSGISGEKVVRKVWPPESRACHPEYRQSSSFHNVAILKVDEPFGIEPVRLAEFDSIESVELDRGTVKYSNDEVDHSTCALFGYRVIEWEDPYGKDEALIRPDRAPIDFWWEDPEALTDRYVRMHYGFWSSNILLDGDYSDLGDGAALLCKNASGEWVLTGLVSGIDKKIADRRDARKTMVHCLRDDLDWLRATIRRLSAEGP